MADRLNTDDEVATYCGRLTCGKLIVQTVGRGRRREFCSETCRRAADRDYKRARAHVELFTEQLTRTQHEVAAYGRPAEEGSLTPEQLARTDRDAHVAWTRASTVVELGGDADRVLAELKLLLLAMRPLLDHAERARALSA